MNVNAYLSDCSLRGLSPLTIGLYKLFLTGFSKVGQDREHLANWLLSYANPRTRHAAWRTVRTYLRWIEAQGLGVNFAAGMRVKCQEASANPPVTRPEFVRILNAIPKTIHGRRDRAFYAMLYFTGVRRDAARLLKRADVNVTDRWAKIVTKGGREGLVTIPRPAALILNAWLAMCPSQTWIFPSTRHPDKPMDGRQLNRNLKRYALAAGVTGKRVHLHGLRHAHATELARHGVPLEIIQQSLMHSDIQTTRIYVDKLVSAQRVRDTLDSVFC